MVAIERLRRRADFLKANRGRRVSTSAFLIRIIPNGRDDARFGLTVTKKLGNAVARNRIKRRLREVVQRVAPSCGRPGYDYVLIARSAALTQSFERLLDDLRAGLVDPRNFPNGQ